MYDQKRRTLQVVNAATRTAASRTADWAERLAIGASAACLLHCLALPLALAALPALSSALSLPESFHVWVLASAIPTALLALTHGRSRHGHSWPLVAGLVGLTLLAIAGLMLEGRSETLVTVLGSTTLAIAHLANWRIRHACC